MLPCGWLAAGEDSCYGHLTVRHRSGLILHIVFITQGFFSDFPAPSE
uniref:Uncharacterized protein n=1 Tax=Anguilla anguilla TaxID=7936 RepID=A0A0E9SJ20_ANGAN